LEAATVPGELDQAPERLSETELTEVHVVEDREVPTVATKTSPLVTVPAPRVTWHVEPEQVVVKLAMCLFTVMVNVADAVLALASVADTV
jgi:hypothetical protein